jgi:hypothetical protein
MLTLVLLGVMAAGTMAAEDPGCDRAKGRTPQPAEHDPKAPQRDEDKQYRFRVQFATHPTRTVHFSYSFGDEGERDLAWDQPGWSTEKVVTPGTHIQLHMRTDAGALATVTCAISWVEDAKRIRVRAHHIARGSTGCDLEYIVRVGEEDYPSK